MTATLLLALIACTTPVPEASPLPPAAEQALPADSIYQLDARLQTHSGHTVGLDVYEGSPTLVSMFYASCPMACPMLIEDIRSLEDKLEPQDRADLRVLLVSLDPDRDTPELMSDVIERHGIETDRWTLARTDESSVREVSAVLGIRYRMLDDGEMNHSSIVTLVDRQGRVVHQLDGLRKDPAPLLEALAGLRP